MIRKVLEGFSQPGRRVHDDRLQRDHRRGARLHRGISGDFELAHHLDGAVCGLGGCRRLARQYSPGGGLGVEGVGLASGAAQAPVASIHFRDTMPCAAGAVKLTNSGQSADELISDQAAVTAAHTVKARARNSR